MLICQLRTVKDYRYHAFPNTEFSYFLTIDILDSVSFQIIF